MASEAALKRRHDKDGPQLRELLIEARDFISAQPWCSKIKKIYCALDLPILAVFLCQIEPKAGADSVHWIVCGDVPPGVVDSSAKSCEEALRQYSDKMSAWARAAIAGEPVSGLGPVLERKSLRPIPPSRELGEMLLSRANLILERIIPEIRHWKD